MAAGQVSDNFENGLSDKWVQSIPARWSADSAGCVSGKYSLHHSFDNPDAGTDRIGIPISDIHADEGSTTWSFIIRHGYDPSSSNNWSVFLMSDVSPAVMSADGNTNGFVLGVNLTGYDDTLRLWKVKGSNLSVVVNCAVNWQSDIGTVKPAKVIVERDKEGNWFIKVTSSDESFVRISSGFDAELFNPSWFGIYYRYSSTRDRLLWIDDIMIDGLFYRDTTPPAVTAVKILNKRSFGICLGEEPVSTFFSKENFYLNSEENKPITVVRKSELEFIAEFSDDFINKAINKLIIRNICDETGNCRGDTVIEFTPVWAETGDVIISEIMADPLPALSLPGKEYLEITNRTTYSINLKNWKLSSEGFYVLFPELVLLPEERRILCLSQDVLLFSQYGKVTGLKQFPALTDGGKAIWLADSLGNLIHGVEYSLDWYGDVLKSGGGWSLEMKDTKFPFYGEGNWIASGSRIGGSPGLVNSVNSDNPDTLFYGILNVFPDDSNTIIVEFSEPVFNLSADLLKIGIDNLEFIDILPHDPLFREFSLKVTFPLRSKEIYKLLASENIRDFAGNRMAKGYFEFGIPEPACPKDILFNELLFNPFPGDPDYIELYNHSEKIIDASRLKITSFNEDSGEPSQPIMVSAEQRCILPGAYYTITTDRNKIKERYKSGDPDHLFEVKDLPSMPDASGHLVLYNMELDKIDEVFYHDSLHNSSLEENEGIALAKDMPYNSSEVVYCWFSETEIMGWGTPGALNFNIDLEAPVIMNSYVSGKNSVEIILSEVPATDFLSLNNYSLNEGRNNPVSVIKNNNLSYRIIFANELNNRSINTITISRICDNSGNCQRDTLLKLAPVWALAGDVVISEIMADPLPQVYLPGKEYLEITNRSDYSLNLKNWKLLTEGQISVIPEIVLDPAEIGILCSIQDTLLFKKFGKVIGIKQFPVLNDEGKLICLTDSTGSLIHGVDYSSDWYGEELKSSGGWSIEMIDLQFPFNYDANWKSSSSVSGGTPGLLNSVAVGRPDISFLGVINVFSVDSLKISVRFSEPVFNLTGNRRSITIDGKEIAEIYTADPLFREFYVIPANPLIKGRVYKLEISGDTEDFAGNSIQNRNFSFGMTEPPVIGDIKFNELLFNPFPGESDYIEFYNCSDKVIDASRLYMVSVNGTTSDTSDLVPVSLTGICILPATYYLITTDREKVLDRYFSSAPDRIYEVTSLPSMPDDEGNLLLLSSELVLIDKISYNEDMHYTLLSGFEGISLEKTGECDFSGEPVNWHSATESSGWGTPGSANSVVPGTINESAIINLSSTKITPDNDGFEDLLSISLNPGANGNIVSLSIFDENGRLIKKVVSNMLTGNEVSLIWDGTADDGTPVRSGIYIILITWFDARGRSESFKRVCTVLR